MGMLTNFIVTIILQDKVTPLYILKGVILTLIILRALLFTHTSYLNKKTSNLLGQCINCGHLHIWSPSSR